MQNNSLLLALQQKNLIPKAVLKKLDAQLRLGQLLECQRLNTDKVAEALADYFGLDYIELNNLSVDTIPFELIPQQQLQQHLILPIKLTGSILHIAIADPADLYALENMRFKINYQLKVTFANYNIIAKLLNDYHSQTIYPLFKKHQVNTPAIERLAQQIFNDAICKGASDIHLEAYKNYYRVRIRIDGLLSEIIQLDTAFSHNIISRLKVLAGLDITEQRLPQDGRFTINTPYGLTRECRLNCCPTLYGEKLVIRLLNANQRALNISELGMPDNLQKTFKQAITKPQGLILVTGPTGSGKTITLYAALKYIADITKNISSIEDPVEISLENINQINVNHKINLNFATVLRALLRQDPDVIMLGEIRDSETVKMAINAAYTGHLVLATLHTNSAAESLIRLLNMGAEPYNLANSLTLIVAQRLIRKLCRHCKQSTHPHIAIPKNKFIKLNPKIYKARGCKHCQQGYQGRCGIFEMLVMNNITQQKISALSNIEITEYLKQQTTQTLWQAAIAQVNNGQTSLEEIYRVALPPA
ncbi:MAG: type II/IV secretion system protein [Gammaproteobacteria bacterium]|nr:type II/IV secretion system protein [Gammaproteobacteria bacterium]